MSQFSTQEVRERLSGHLIERKRALSSFTPQEIQNQQSTVNGVALNAPRATLTGLNAGQLLEFAVNLLNLPSHPTRLSCGLRRILS